MNPNLTPIYQLKYIPVHLLTRYREYPDGTVQIETLSSLLTILFAPGSQSFQSTSKQSKSGTLWTTSLTTSLRAKISEEGPVMLFVRLCDGTIYVIGTPDLPVFFNNTHTDQLRSFSIEHESPKAMLTLRNPTLFQP